MTGASAKNYGGLGAGSWNVVDMELWTAAANWARVICSPRRRVEIDNGCGRARTKAAGLAASNCRFAATTTTL